MVRITPYCPEPDYDDLEDDRPLAEKEAQTQCAATLRAMSVRRMMRKNRMPTTMRQLADLTGMSAGDLRQVIRKGLAEGWILKTDGRRKDHDRGSYSALYVLDPDDGLFKPNAPRKPSDCGAAMSIWIQAWNHG